MKQKVMAQTPLPPDTSMYSLIEIIVVCGTFITVVWRWIDAYFKSLKDNKQEFIENVVRATVKATLDGELKNIRDDINKLFEYRESDRIHFDGKVDTIIKEIRK